MRRLIIGVAVAATFAAPGQAADPQRDEADRLFRQAEEAYEANDYARAAELMGRSYQVFPMAETAFNAAASYQNAGDMHQAQEYFARYLNHRPETWRNEAVRDAWQALENNPYGEDYELCALLSRLLWTINEAEGGEGFVGFRVIKEAGRMAEFGIEAHRDFDFSRSGLMFECSVEIHSVGANLFNAGISHLYAGDYDASGRAFHRWANGHAQGRDHRVQQALESFDAEASDTPAQRPRRCARLSAVKEAIVVASGLDAGPGAIENDATQYAEIARRLYRMDHFVQAGDLLRCAHQLVPDVGYLYDAAVAYIAAEEWLTAQLSLQGYLAAQPDVRRHPDVQAAEAALEEDPYASDPHAAYNFRQLVEAIRRAEGRPQP